MKFIKGNRVIAKWQPEYGTGIVKSVQNENHVIVEFPENGKILTFAVRDEDECPLQIRIWGKGELVRVKTEQGTGIIIERIEKQSMGGIRYMYRVQLVSERVVLVNEGDLEGVETIEEPLDKLKKGKFCDVIEYDLKNLAIKLDFLYRYEHLSCLSSSRIDLKPHQISVVDRVVSNYPHKFLLADEVGLGKTIEAGLIIKEMKARGLVERVLIIVPANLTIQWLWEMKNKFNEQFALYDAHRIKQETFENPGANIWTLKDNVIISRQLLTHRKSRKSDENKKMWEEIKEAVWDLVIFDEAHHLRRHYDGERSQGRSTIAYRMAEEVKEGTKYILFLTATPLQIHDYELYSLIELLDPALFCNYSEFRQNRGRISQVNMAVKSLENYHTLTKDKESQLKHTIKSLLSQEDLKAGKFNAIEREKLINQLLPLHKLSEIMIRNRKARVGGFTKRIPENIVITTTKDEAEIYNEVTEYVRTNYNRALAAKNRAIGFMMVNFQKYLSSSPHACARSFRRRIERLKDIDYLQSLYERRGEDIEVCSRLNNEEMTERTSEVDLDDFTKEFIGAVSCKDYRTFKTFMKNINQEIRTLEGLEKKLTALSADSKYEKLLKVLQLIKEEDPQDKIMIFTQSKDTQRYLRDKLREKFGVVIFHGELSLEEKDSLISRFKSKWDVDICISTEAGGEGRNLQFCRIIINYDLPWNPMRVEQRIGRLDRIGQKRDVHIYNLALKDTIEERVLEVLHKRIKIFEETVGGLDPILEGFEDRIKKMAIENTLDDFNDITVKVARAIEAEKKIGDFVMDMRSYRKDEIEKLLKNAHPVSAKDILNFTMLFIKKYNLQYQKQGYMVGKITLHKYINANLPRARHRVYNVCFDHEIAQEREELDLLGFGHELFDDMINYCLKEIKAHATFKIIRNGQFSGTEGILFLYIITFRGISTTRKLVPIFLSLEGEYLESIGEVVIQTKSLQIDTEKFNVTDTLDKIDLDILKRKSEDILDNFVEKELQKIGKEQDANYEKEIKKTKRYYNFRFDQLALKRAYVAGQIKKFEVSEDEGVRKVIPAWRGRLLSIEENKKSLTKEFKNKLKNIEEGKEISYSSELWNVAFVKII